MTKKCVLKAALMFTIGAGMGTFFTNKVLKDYYKDESDKKMIAYRDYILDQAEEGKIMHTEDLPEDVVYYGEPDEKLAVTKEMEDQARRDEVEHKIIASKYSQEVNKAKEQFKPDFGALPYIITEEKYDGIDGDFEKESVYFYQDDNIFADDEEEVIVNSENVVGIITEEIFGDCDVIHVRNEGTETDYEVIRVKGSYSEMVQGYQN